MAPVRRDLPPGTVTLLFTDIEGSTKLLHELGAEAYARALAEHRRTLRETFTRHGGVEVDTQGDAFFYAFAEAAEAVAAARDGQEGLAAGPIRVRMGLHSGEPHLTGEGYVGRDVHKGARIAAAGHGGQVLLSKETRDLTGADVTDLGEHRLKDFDEPIWIFQLGPERHPPLKTISNTNLPRPASSFVGRAREVAEVVALFRAGTRLVTFTGPGGSGKTRLAIEAASALLPDHRNGVFWVGLATITEPGDVLDTIAQTLGAKDDVQAFIGEREMLLLLDNFEQVIGAAVDVSALLAACRNVCVFVTSREVLRVQGEVEYAVPPLAGPDAVSLFCARSGLEADDAIADLCRRLDDLPLAVELAAARTSVLTPTQILERLSSRLDLLKGGRDALPRQATLRSTIAWSHDLLQEEERRLFARLAVFNGGCTLEAAEDIARADIDGVQSLVDKSLVRRAGNRFWMLETIKEYATERLNDLGEGDDLRRRHAAYFIALAEEAEPDLLAGKTIGWLDRLESEHGNMRTAVEFLEASGAHEDVLRLTGALSQFWALKGNFVEGARRLERALEADQRPTPARAKALDGASWMASALGNIDLCRRRAEEALALHRAFGNTWAAAGSEWQLGYLAVEEGDFEGAQRLVESAVGVFREAGDDHSDLLATRTLAWTYEKRGDLDTARAMNQETLRRARMLGNRAVEAVLLGQLAMIALDQNRPAEAAPILREQLPIHREIGDVLEQVVDLCRVGRTLAALGREGEAAVLASCIEALRDEFGALWPWAAQMNADTIASVRRELAPGAFEAAWNKGQRMTLDDAYKFALASLD